MTEKDIECDSDIDVSEDMTDPVVEVLETENDTEPTTKRKRTNSSKVPKHLSKKMKNNKLYKPPTVDELNNLKEAETMFHSSLFRLQVEELITELKSQMKLKSGIQTWLKALKSFLKDLPETEQCPIDEQPWLKKVVKVPLKFEPKNKTAVFKFLPPEEVVEIGSYVLETVCAPKPVIDVAVKIPKACWQKADYLNHIYHRKRALYLTYLAQALRKCNLVENLKFSHHFGCHLKPVLLLEPTGKLGKNFTICLMPFPELDSFKLLRFIPERNNIRPSWFCNSDSSEQSENIPTPYYNSTVLVDLLIPQLTEFLKERISTQSLKDGIMLLKVWCIQREIYGAQSTANGFVLSMLVCHLLMKRKISPLMSSYQVFRNALLTFSRGNWIENGINFTTDKFAPTLQVLHKMFDVVFVEPSGFLNICFDITKEAYLILQHEASIALQILDGASSNSFDLLFMNKVPFYQKFDSCIHIKDTRNLEVCTSAMKLEHNVIDHGGDIITVVTPKLCEVLKKGLGERILLLASRNQPLQMWSVSKLPPSTNDFNRTVTFGILLNQELLSSNLEKGPTADNPETKEFREFWGDKSDFRRFKDGSIHEAVLWPANTIEEKRCVFAQITKHLLQRHAGLDPDFIICTGNELHSVLSLPDTVLPEEYVGYGTGEELFFTFMQSFNELTKQLRKLKKLPLFISAVQGTSPVFRFCEVFPPFSRLHTCMKSVCEVRGESLTIIHNSEKAPTYVQPLEIIIHLEGSGKWPDDVEAIRRVKAALYIKIKQLLNESGTTARTTQNYVDVLKDGYVFRLKIACHKEIGLLKLVKMDDGMTKIRENKASKELQLTTETLPKLNSALYGIHQHHNSFGTACRLAKRWISSQLLLDYVNEILVELLVAYVYINPDPNTCPSVPQVAFQRFLALIYTFDWETYPLVVNFNVELKKSEISEMTSQFTSQRATLPPMVIITPLDRTGILFTKDTLTNFILQGLKSLAKASLVTLESQLNDPETADFKQIFRPPLDPYEVLIHLNLDQVPKACFAVDELDNVKQRQYKSYHKRNVESMPVIDYDPVKFYLQELRDSFGDIAWFFYDHLGGTYIAVTWKPEAFSSKMFKVSSIKGCMVSGSNADGTVNIVPNIEPILEDFKKLGDGLVKSIEQKTEKWAVT